MDITNAVADLTKKYQQFDNPLSIIGGASARPIIISAKKIMEFLEPSQKLTNYYLDLEQAGIDYDNADFGNKESVIHFTSLFLNEVKNIRASTKPSKASHVHQATLPYAPQPINLYVQQHNHQEMHVENINISSEISTYFIPLYKYIKESNLPRKTEALSKVQSIEKEVKKEAPNRSIISSALKFLKDMGYELVVQSILEIVKKVFGF